MEGTRWRGLFRVLTVAAVSVSALVVLGDTVGAADTGEATYQARCAACHGEKGEGRGAFPTLSGNPIVDDETAVAVVVRSGRGVMPAFSQLSGEEVAALTTFLRTTWGTAPEGDSDSEGTTGTAQSGGSTGVTGTTAPGGQGEGGQPAQPGDPAAGEALFVGSTAFESGAPPCMSCHSAGANGRAGGGRILGTDLTDLAGRASGAAGISAMLAAPAFPVMLAAYEDRPLTEQERADLGAYFEQLAASGVTSGSVTAGKLWLAGAAGTAMLFGLMGLLWPRHRVTAGERLRGGSL